MYNLFSNLIKSQMTEDIQKNIKEWNRFELIDYIKMKAEEIFRSLDKDIFILAKKNVFFVCESIRAGNISLAHEIYFGFYLELTTRIYTNREEGNKVKVFVEGLDYTDIFYNIAKLKWDCGDYDNALYYIFEADSQNVKHNNRQPGEFINFLINSDGYVLWNFVPSITGDFSNFCHCFNIYKIEGFLSHRIDGSLLLNVLNSFDLLILLQFINSVNRYHNFLLTKSNQYKSLRQYRVLGELSWLFECYLKNKFGSTDSTLNRLITEKLLSSSKKTWQIYREFELIKGLSTINTKSNKYKEEAIEYLIRKAREETDCDRLAAIYLKIICLVRNLTSHYIDGNFFIFKDSKYSIELYFIILGCYFIAHKLVV